MGRGAFAVAGAQGISPWIVLDAAGRTASAATAVPTAAPATRSCRRLRFRVLIADLRFGSSMALAGPSRLRAGLRLAGSALRGAAAPGRDPDGGAAGPRLERRCGRELLDRQRDDDAFRAAAAVMAVRKDRRPARLRARQDG